MYKLQRRIANGLPSVLRVADGASIPIGSGNRDDQEYQAWLIAGNTPQDADPEPARPPRAIIPDDADELDTRAAQVVSGMATWLEAAKGSGTTAAQDKAQLRRVTVAMLWVARRMGL